MPKRSVVAGHIVRNVEKARRLDPSLTWKTAAKELGISESSLYKMRAGTRTGQGSIRTRVMRPPKEGIFTVQFKNIDGRVATRNMRVANVDTEAEGLVIRHDRPRVRRAIVHELEAEEQGRVRQLHGSLPWTRRQRRTLYVNKVWEPDYAAASSFLVHGKWVR